MQTSWCLCLPGRKIFYSATVLLFCNNSKLQISAFYLHASQHIKTLYITYMYIFCILQNIQYTYIKKNRNNWTRRNRIKQGIKHRWLQQCSANSLTEMIICLVLSDYFYGLVLNMLNMPVKSKRHLTFRYHAVSLPSMLPTGAINRALVSWLCAVQIPQSLVTRCCVWPTSLSPVVMVSTWLLQQKINSQRLGCFSISDVAIILLTG